MDPGADRGKPGPRKQKPMTGRSYLLLALVEHGRHMDCAPEVAFAASDVILAGDQLPLSWKLIS